MVAEHSCGRKRRPSSTLNARQDDSLLSLILAFLVLVGDLAQLVRFQKDDLAKSLVGIDARRQRRGVGDLQRDVAFPLRLERRDINNDAAARVGGLSQADGQDIARNAKLFHRPR